MVLLKRRFCRTADALAVFMAAVRQLQVRYYGNSLLRWMSRLTGAAVALVLVLFLWFSINHYSGMARMNEELVEQRERAMPAKLKDGAVLREVWKGKYSWTDFCQSAVISVSPETATLFKAEIEKTSVKGAEDDSWKLTPGGHLPRCFGKEDLAALALLMKRTGYLYTTSGARTDYEEQVPRVWLFAN